MQHAFLEFYHTFFDISLVVAPVYLLIAVAAAWLVYRYRRMSGGFWQWLTPAKIYLHPSHLIDLQLFVVTRGLAAFGLIAKVTLTTATAALVADLFRAPLVAPQNHAPLFLAVLLWLPTDFANYWLHRIFHAWSRLWPLHAVHHSAEVLTPFTTYRHHPLETLISVAGQTVVIGLIQGPLIGTAAQSATVAEIAGINACFVIANAALAALHHSHVWLSYGPWLERFIISPAQHQIHHSIHQDHYDKNFGNSLALWDWMFGTLYIIRGTEAVKFGLDGESDQPLKTQRLWTVLSDPIRRMIRA